MEQHGAIKFSVSEVTRLLDALASREPLDVFHRQIAKRLDLELKWELLAKDGTVLGRYTYFPSRAAEHNAGSLKNVLTVRDRNTGEIHRRIQTRWTMRTLEELGGTEPQIEDIPRRRSEPEGDSDGLHTQ